MAKPRNASPIGAEQPQGLAAISKLARVNAPKQARSEQRLADIVQALNVLLDGRSFDDITIPEIAARAGCVPASIYARFKDKRSILVALHESFRNQQVAQIEESLSTDAHKDLSLDDSIRLILRNLTRHYSRRQHMLRSTLLLDDQEIYEGAGALIALVSTRVSAILRQKLPKRRIMSEERVDLAVRSVVALLQQRLIFRPASVGRFAPSDDCQIASEITIVFRSILQIGD
ncbi:TetR/AcrR family transcriptional regulator [Bradyrhizobium sp. Arg237L]|uniref:TetR/AcrR family transcriptional regulator n=1 Tax=Bradyrhizobium sp. Arg237L TaxID=3003352 RepID=UPI00249F7B73|nr:TetR/AcrR family transcriptional regulator [Bradyrhizobium sp. Arg237L]MDI4231262.1 TetR/AcrR family transcriptional regulator [Bradyrhizobium sp. Arg237L]